MLLGSISVNIITLRYTGLSPSSVQLPNCFRFTHDILNFMAIRSFNIPLPHICNAASFYTYMV